MKTNALLTLPGNDTPLDQYTSETSNRDFAELKKIVKKRGLLDKQPVYYTYRVLLLIGLLALSMVFLLVVNSFLLQLINAVFMAFVFAQIGLLSHEAGHRQMFHHSWKHDLIGLVGGNLCIGMSYAWWLDKHNSHHSHPNQVDMDPDIEIPFLEFTGKEDVTNISKFRQFLVKHQALIFLPALMTVAIGLQVNSVKFLLRGKTKYYALEWASMIAHFVLYFAVVFSRMNFWQALIFIALNQAVAGFYLGSIFAPNHKGMPVLDKESKVGFLHRQVMTSRNIYGNPLVDFIYGGLNYQIEHHLFPSMPRNKLKEARGLVKLFCEERNIPYHETYVLQSFKEILQHLYEIGAPLRRFS
ncbi:fatty acid desaturase family protein [Dictyobacter kobayashii]|uniref:Delta fatty acid desaturase n=1 Tax=Dictyobacter kobayashii TaxID=2014872 RepID=A0A402AUN8_9CHLR|nr:acyl-CoA desaturase [Dictyobacter kobayashii]GCE22743.1 delta fatty acid desaturase [Dictyobacter kobayashii]